MLPDTSALVPSDITENEAAKLYEPLQVWQTRVLEISPGLSEEPLACKLLNADIVDSEGFGIRERNEIIPYDALSYSWGYPEMTYPLLVNGYRFLVTPILATALMHLRHDSKEKYVWIDAFCINQRDSQEKSMQVVNILRIFEKAQKYTLGLEMSRSGLSSPLVY